jgi:hypothetical protein
MSVPQIAENDQRPKRQRFLGPRVPPSLFGAYLVQGPRIIIADLRDLVLSPFVSASALTAMLVAAALALVTIKPGGMRELQWHPNGDEWQYYLKGSARMTVFNTGPHANTTDFRAGDVGLVRRNLGHYV